MDDYTDRGTEWKFYEQAEIIDYFDTTSDDVNVLRPELQFRKFQGQFGNINEIGCDITDPLFGVCQLSACNNYGKDGQPFGGDPTHSLPSPPACGVRKYYRLCDKV